MLYTIVTLLSFSHLGMQSWCARICVEMKGEVKVCHCMQVLKRRYSTQIAIDVQISKCDLSKFAYSGSGVNTLRSVFYSVALLGEFAFFMSFTQRSLSAANANHTNFKIEHYSTAQIFAKQLRGWWKEAWNLVVQWFFLFVVINQSSCHFQVQHCKSSISNRNLAHTQKRIASCT